VRIRVVVGELEVSRKEGGLVEGQVTSWDKVGVITGLGAETTYGYRLREPGGVQRRVEFEPFKVVERFTIVEQKNGKAASALLGRSSGRETERPT
jgi:hypothetical protein